MREPIDIILNDTALLTACPEILIQDVSHTATAFTRNWARLANRDGMILGNERTEGCGVGIKFVLPVLDYAERMEALGAIKAWGRRGGILETGDRPGQRLRVACEKMPSMASVKDIGDVMEIQFKAYTIPYWESKNATMRGVSSSSSWEGTLTVPGNVDGAFVEADVTAKAAVTTFTLTVGDTSITLSGLSMQNGQIAKIAYDDRGIQSIKIGSTSILGKRTGSDDLISVCGDNAASFSADANVQVTFKVRGLWL